MDFLSSLNLSDLPEQQTRTCHPSINDALECNPMIRIGFDVCCHCAKDDISILCKGCKRVRYCSMECLKADANPPTDGEEQSSLGHSSIVCSLLKTCEMDELVEENADDDDSKRSKKKKSTTKIDVESVQNRIQSEYESYPATLSNILVDGPCYQTILKEKKKKGISIHIIGASKEAELWDLDDYNNDSKNMNSSSSSSSSSTVIVWDAYAEALYEMATTYQLAYINLLFVGPSCPSNNQKVHRWLTMEGVESSKPKSSKNVCQLTMETYRCDNYNDDSKFRQKDNPPDMVVLFNPGLTCPDYTSWKETLQLIPSGAPFLITTNTEMEGIADCQYLYQHNLIEKLPPGLESIIMMEDETEAESNNTNNDDDDETDNMMFFTENPYAGQRVRQSGTMANDLFVKNRWILGGILECSSNNKTNDDDDDNNEEKNTKKRKSKSSSKQTSTKKKRNKNKQNPGLM